MTLRRLAGVSTGRIRRLAFGLLLSQGIGWGGGLSAQQAATVLGRVLDQETRAPLQGAFVALMDEGGVRRAAVLSDQTGRFVLRAPAPGTFRLRVERIGTESAFSEFFQVTPGQVITRDLETRPAAVTLQGVEVTGDARCELDEDEGSATVRLWEEARKALEVAEWVDEIGYIYETRSFRRLLDRRARRVREETSELGIRAGRGAFRSLEPELLVRDGFIQEEGESQVYYAPDAAALLSDAFLSSHCFRAVREDDRLGLAFEPAPGRSGSDILGTLWFTRQGLLDHVEFRYEELLNERDARLGGEIFLQRLEEGAWIVQAWRIRMPEYQIHESPSGERTRRTLIGVSEVGGEVLTARRAEAINTVFSARRGAVRGVASSADGAPLAGAEVFLSGTGYAATTAADGSFLLEGVLPGVYDLVLDHPAVASLGELSVGTTAEVAEDSVAFAPVQVPRRRDLLVDRCEERVLLELSEPDFRDPGAPSVLGGVVLDSDGRPVRDWPVRIRWTRIDPNVAGALQESWRATVVLSGPRGGWAVCGLPADVYITVETAETRLERAAVEAGDGDWGQRQGVGRLGGGDVVWVDARAGG